ncbi:hypothetical protein D9757_005558 [Collybiopsis confluens]|uniref:Protein BIG1 n=1 Tax=Collybiopsis confluens TaxID=2823264 RepID=A0A8H5M8W0_9AGAR|nr:hypothetical protein D9757_005558 [Collybiopsis confluens]
MVNLAIFNERVGLQDLSERETEFLNIVDWGKAANIRLLNCPNFHDDPSGLPARFFSFSSISIFKYGASDCLVVSEQLFDTILLNDDICDHEAIVLVHQPGLHASDLRQLSKSSHIARSLSSAPSTRQYAYSLSSFDDGPSEFALSVSKKCHANVGHLRPGLSLSSSTKSTVVIVNLPGLDFEGSRKDSMADHDALLATMLESLRSSNQIIILTGSAPILSKRQEDLSTSPRPALELSSSSSPASPSAMAKNKGGILHRYQLLTPGLIMVLLIVLFVFLPILYFGISALASIQSSVRLDAMPKGYNANERKNQ